MRARNATGNLVNERTVRRLPELPLASQPANAAGQVVKQVRDASGAVIEYTLHNAAKIVGSRVASTPQR